MIIKLKEMPIKEPMFKKEFTNIKELEKIIYDHLKDFGQIPPTAITLSIDVKVTALITE